MCKIFANKPYQCLPHLFLKNGVGKLFRNDKLLIFNKSYSDRRRLVYNVGQ